jgi:glyoxylate/hydroxypyruvate reductase A
LPQAQIELWQPGAASADYAVVWAPPQQLFDEQPQLRGVFAIGAGVDALLKLHLPPQAALVRLDDAGMAVQMAEYVCHAVIRHFRQFDVVATDIQQGQWTLHKPRQRADFPVGVMGLGVLGAPVAQALAHFEFPVLGWSRSAKTIASVRCLHGAAQFQAFLSGSRILVNLLPLTPDTCDIMNRTALSYLQPGGYVINVARGAHLVDEDLLALLHSGHLAGATLDVFRQEPLPPQHPFWHEPKITITPHSSARTLRLPSIAQIASKILAFERGDAVIGCVDVGRGY